MSRKSQRAYLDNYYRTFSEPDARDAWEEYAEWGGFSSFTDEQAAAAKPQPLPPRTLLEQLLGMRLEDAYTAAKCTFPYDLRIVGRDGAWLSIYDKGTLKRTRINLYVQDNIVINAFVG